PDASTHARDHGMTRGRHGGDHEAEVRPAAAGGPQAANITIRPIPAGEHARPQRYGTRSHTGPDDGYDLDISRLLQSILPHDPLQPTGRAHGHGEALRRAGHHGSMAGDLYRRDTRRRRYQLPPGG